jgi:hypothetical protein
MSHPYTKFENTRTRKVISDALFELEEKQNFILQTKKDADDLAVFRAREIEPVIDFETFIVSLESNKEQ